jgi:hypothetical protein
VTESSRTRRALPLALAILVAAGAMAGLLAGLPPAGGSAAKYPDAAEIPTDGRRVEALAPAPFGTPGAVLQLVVVLACPAICLGMGFLQRFEGGGHRAGRAVERPSGQERE